MSSPSGRAGSAALRLAQSLGVPATSARVLHDGSNVLVALAPQPLVARVAAVTARVRMRPAEALQRDVQLAGWLAAQGARVVAPADELPPGPHQAEGFGLTYWRFVEVLGTVSEPDVAAAELLDLHRLSVAYEGALPGVQPLISDALRGVALARDAGVVTRHDAQRLEAAGLRFTREIPRGAFPLHGDAHPGNLLRTPDGLRWTDFEDTWRGPLEWDLACLHETSRLDGAAAVARYRELCAREFLVDDDVLAACVRLRRWQGVCWSLVFAADDPAHLPRAAVALREWLARD
ncbi:phosphotransferase family protein [Spongisporangium articulatum]|uniref:Phosphotransferase family protein n=1 Tax=Spongisporangium articulatum TaxID=3362603 RepID=A0ABW8AR53_9ACTN